VLAQTRRRGSHGRLVIPPAQGQQSLAVVAGGVLLQEGDPCQRTPTGACPRGSPVQGAGHGEGVAPCLGHPTGIRAAVEGVGTSLPQPDLPTPGLTGAGSPSSGNAQLLMALLMARVPAGLMARAQPDKATSWGGTPVSPHLNHVVQ